MGEKRVSEEDLVRYHQAAAKLESCRKQRNGLEQAIKVAEDSIEDTKLLESRAQSMVDAAVKAMGGVPHHGKEAGLEGQWVVGDADPSRLPKPAAQEIFTEKKGPKKK